MQIDDVTAKSVVLEVDDEETNFLSPLVEEIEQPAVCKFCLAYIIHPGFP